MVVQLQRQIDAGQSTKHTPGASSSMSKRERSVAPIIASEACGGPAFEHRIDRAAEPLRDDRQRLRVAVPTDQLLMPCLCRVVTSQKQTRRLTEGPA